MSAANQLNSKLNKQTDNKSVNHRTHTLSLAHSTTMRKRTQPESSSSSSPASKSEPRATDEQIKTSSNDSIHVSSAKRSGLVWTVAFATLICASYGVYYYQYEHMPPPLTTEQAGRRGFSELEAMKHVKALTQLGPHAVGSDALDRALQVVFVVLSFSLLFFFSFK